MMSVRTKDANAKVAFEALRRAKMKFPGRQLVVESDKWGFTKFTREQYAEMRQAAYRSGRKQREVHCQARTPRFLSKSSSGTSPFKAFALKI